VQVTSSVTRGSTRNRGYFPSDEALIKVVYLRCEDMGRTRRGRGRVGKTG
jgi:transposase-like protein